MPKVKNISGGELDVRVPGFEALVADGETIDGPDFQPDGESPIVWPPDKWQPVTSKVKPETVAKSDTSSG